MKTLTTLLLMAIFTSCKANEEAYTTEKTDMQNDDIIELVEENNVDAVAKALDKGANVNTQDASKRSLLLLATIAQQAEMIKLLAERGANVNLQANNQDSPFLYAGATGQTDALRLFLTKGAKFDIYNRYNGTALIPACERGHVETVRLLANTKGYPVNHVNRLGWTGLMEAIVLGDGSEKYQQIVQILKDAGADMTIPDHNGTTPVEHAKNRGFTQIVEILSN